MKDKCRLLLQTYDEVFVVDVAFDKFGKTLAVLDNIDSAALADHEEDIVRRLARRLADDAKQASLKRTFLFAGPAVAYRIQSLTCLYSSPVRPTIIGMCGESPGRRL
jgi:hypothetical protein